MRGISAVEQAVVASGVQAEFVRLSVLDDELEVWRDLTTWPGFNAVKQLTWKAAVNDPHMTFDAVLAREVYDLSLAPLITESPLNRAFDATNDYEPLLKLNREVKIEVAIVPMDSQPGETDWKLFFHGWIDQLDSAKGKDISLSGRDIFGRLAQQYIKEELVYAFATDGGMVTLRQWEPEMNIVVGQYVIPAARGAPTDENPAGDPGYNRFFQATSDGLAGLVEPDWSLSVVPDGTGEWGITGAPTLTGFPVQEVIQKILDDNVLSGDSAITLWTPTDPLWDVKEFMQQRGFTMEVVRALATQIGWDARGQWREVFAGIFELQLKLYAPERDSPSVVHTFTPADYEEPSKLAVDISTIRNSVRVIYKNSADLWPDGTPKRAEVIATDPDSIEEFGELWSELQEDENGNIDTETEAERLADAFISDCAFPTAEVAIPLTRAFPWVELNDFYKFEADGVHSSEDLELAVVGWTHSFVKGHMETALELRGRPTIGHAVHLEKEWHPKKPIKDFGHRLKHFAAPKTVTPNFREIVGGIHVVFENQQKRENLLTEYEIHIGAEPDFEPDTTTLQAITAGLEMSLPYQNPNGMDGEGAPHYGCVVPRYYNAGQLVRGQPSARVEFTPGRAHATHLQDEIAIGDYPLNGGFETRYKGVGFPDHWYGSDAISGQPAVLDTDVFVMEDTDGVSGGRYIKFVSNDSYGPVLASAKLPIINEGIATDVRYGTAHRLTAWVKADTGNDAGAALTIAMQVVDFEGTNLGFAAFLFCASDSKPGQWQKLEMNFRLSANSAARSSYIYLKSNLGADGSIWYVDEVRVTQIGTPWYEVGLTDTFTDNYESVPDFENDWQNYGARPHEICCFRKDKYGRVHIKGLAQSTDDDSFGTGNAIFRLPLGYRPEETIHLATTANGQHAQLEIDADGWVYVGAADSAGWVSYVSIACSFETWDEDPPGL